METHPAIDIVRVLETRPIGRFQLMTLALGVLALFVNGLDYSAVNVAAPTIARGLHIAPSAMRDVFGWSFGGIFVGSVLLGFFGDRYGRKPGLLVAVLAYSIPALLTAFAHSVGELSLYRFLAGVGIGGAVPNTIALLTETAPKRYRVSFVMAAFVGYSTGNATIALVAAWLSPIFGWQIVFLVAGGMGLILSVVLAIGLSESLPFLAETCADVPELRRLLARAAPEIVLPDNARLTSHVESAHSKFALSMLFESYRRVATPLLWIAFFAESLTFMTYSAWLAVILEQAGLPPRAAALTFSYGAMAAIAAILLFGRLIDHFGPRATVVPALLTVASIVKLGGGGLSPLMLSVTAVVAMACAAATHQSLNGIVGGFYPTVVRGNGVGYATGMGRLSAIIGPIIAGGLMAANAPIQVTLWVIAAPEIVVASAALALDFVRRRPSAAADFACVAATAET